MGERRRGLTRQGTTPRGRHPGTAPQAHPDEHTQQTLPEHGEPSYDGEAGRAVSQCGRLWSDGMARGTFSSRQDRIEGGHALRFWAHRVQRP